MSHEPVLTSENSVKRKFSAKGLAKADPARSYDQDQQAHLHDRHAEEDGKEYLFALVVQVEHLQDRARKREGQEPPGKDGAPTARQVVVDLFFLVMTTSHRRREVLAEPEIELQRLSGAFFLAVLIHRMYPYPTVAKKTV
jgi:hypothetical protein